MTDPLIERLRTRTARILRESSDLSARCPDLDEIRDLHDPTWCRAVDRGHQCDRREGHQTGSGWDRLEHHRCRGCGRVWT